MRRLLAVLSSVAVALGMLVGVTTPASAANVGTVTVTSGTPPTVSPSVITGQVGDTFTISYSGGAGLDVVGAAVSLTGGSNCQFSGTCGVSSPGASFTIDGAGVVTVDESTQLSTFTIVIGGGSSGPKDPALVYPTAYLNYNGGRCVAARQKVTRRGGFFTHIDLPFELLCERSGYNLAGWARSADATTAEFASGTRVPIGNESFTLYAVWVPTGTLITYDANIGADSACIDAAGDEVPAGEGRTVTQLNPETLASSAPCTPDNEQLKLAGWATSGDGPVAFELGAPVSLPAGTRQTLFAVWQPTKTDIRCYGGLDSGNRQLPFQCTDFGYVPEGWAAQLDVLVFNTFGRDAALEVQEISVPSDLNGTLRRLQTPDDCSPDKTIPSGATCIVRFAWTPAEVGFLRGFLSLDDVPLTVCVSGQDECVSNPAGQGLRGSSYSPQALTRSESKSIVIEAERGLVDGEPGITVVGRTEGLGDFVEVVPVLIDSGLVEVKDSDAQRLRQDGSFRWQVKTRRALAVEFVSEDRSVRSNRVRLGESIVISGERELVRGAPGIRVEGTAPDLAAGDKVIPWIRVPGQVGFTQAKARPEVSANGTFTWERRTTSKSYVFFTSEDGSSVSNRIALPWA